MVGKKEKWEMRIFLVISNLSSLFNEIEFFLLCFIRFQHSFVLVIKLFFLIFPLITLDSVENFLILFSFQLEIVFGHCSRVKKKEFSFFNFQLDYKAFYEQLELNTKHKEFHFLVKLKNLKERWDCVVSEAMHHWKS